MVQDEQTMTLLNSSDWVTILSELDKTELKVYI